jgi:hypothetical protein
VGGKTNAAVVVSGGGLGRTRQGPSARSGSLQGGVPASCHRAYSPRQHACSRRGGHVALTAEEESAQILECIMYTTVRSYALDTLLIVWRERPSGDIDIDIDSAARGSTA